MWIIFSILLSTKRVVVKILSTKTGNTDLVKGKMEYILFDLSERGDRINLLKITGPPEKIYNDYVDHYGDKRDRYEPRVGESTQDNPAERRTPFRWID